MGDSSKVLDQEGIKTLIDSLYALELTGPNLKRVAKQLEEIQKSTERDSRAVGVSGAAHPSRGHGRFTKSSGPNGKSSGDAEAISSSGRGQKNNGQSKGLLSKLRGFVYWRNR